MSAFSKKGTLVGDPQFLDVGGCGGSLKLQLWSDCWVHHCDGEYHDVSEFSGPPLMRAQMLMPVGRLL